MAKLKQEDRLKVKFDYELAALRREFTLINKQYKQSVNGIKHLQDPRLYNRLLRPINRDFEDSCNSLKNRILAMSYQYKLKLKKMHAEERVRESEERVRESEERMRLLNKEIKALERLAY